MLYEERNSEAIAATLNTSNVKRNPDGPPAETRMPRNSRKLLSDRALRDQIAIHI